MGNKKKKCLYCLRPFTPNPRKGDRQKTCGRRRCRKKQKRQTDRLWRKANLTWCAGRREKVCIWAKAYPDYWKRYRSKHPAYETENRRQSRERMRSRRSLFAKQDLILSSKEKYLKGLDEIRWQHGLFAKQDLIQKVHSPQIQGILAYLIVRDCLQNQPRWTQGPREA